LSRTILGIRARAVTHLKDNWRKKYFSRRCFTAADKEFDERVESETSGAEARNQKKRLIAAVNRCATQNQNFSATCKATSENQATYRSGEPLRGERNTNFVRKLKERSVGTGLLFTALTVPMCSDFGTDGRSISDN